MSPPPSLLRAPIVEAVLDLDCDLPADYRLAEPQEEAKQPHAVIDRVARALAERYPKLRLRTSRGVTISELIRSEPKVPAHRALEAVQFVQADERQLVQWRSGGFSFNRLAPYEGLDQYLGEIERTWHLFVETAAPRFVRSVRLRTINRIRVPLINGEPDLVGSFADAPELPAGGRLRRLDFFQQQHAIDPVFGIGVELVLASQASEAHAVPVIFDSIVASPALELDPVDWASILEWIQRLRRLKNELFTQTLSPACLERLRS
ncbi:MAG: TIGR04255 family protein [Planctomycetes bacterium]|nr:TIGR04255 family protein [Planctomycetota bacterium]